MEIVRDVAAVIGVILSVISLITIISKSARQFVAGLFKKYGRDDELSDSIKEIRSLLEKHISDESNIRKEILGMNEINLEFTRTMCRDMVKRMFYKYKDARILPLYERKTLMSIEDLYVTTLKGNSFAAFLINEMKSWEIDYDSSYPEEDSK